MKKILLPLHIILLLQIAVSSTAQFSINAEYRARTELRDGYTVLSIPGTDPAVFVSQRARISADYKNEFIHLRFTPQDVRIWGDEKLASSTGVYGDEASLDLIEGFVGLKTGKAAWVYVGRQQLVYDNQRLLAARDWNQLGMAYDAAVLQLNLDQWKLHAGFSWNSNAESLILEQYPSNRIRSLNFLWLNRKFTEEINSSLLHISSGSTESDTTTAMNFRHTTGLYSKYNIGAISVWADVYYQYGKNQAGNSISAVLFDADVNYHTEILAIGAGISYLSGNKYDAATSDDHLFNSLYGARHKYFGSMDYFRDFSKHTAGRGLVDGYLYLTFTPIKTISISNTLHYFSLANELSADQTDVYLGVENDLSLKVKLNKWAQLQAGYSVMSPGETLKVIQKIDDAKIPQFVYLQLTVKAELFTNQTATN